MKGRLHAVVTTVQEPTPAMEVLTTTLQRYGAVCVVVGDEKGPASFDLTGSVFLSLSQQLGSPFQLASELPVGHYARKNIGYLTAIARGATSIFDTDDDNAPLPHWAPRRETARALRVDTRGWFNAYSCFTEERLWPRGFPLDELASTDDRDSTTSASTSDVRAPIQQGLSNGAPDVDAIWRLVMDRSITFADGRSVLLGRNVWCPFNSQCTWWWPVAYPLLYLPSSCSFRMTDIWRSLVAQRCVWELGAGVLFAGPEVIQERNPHDLMRDFEDEIPGHRWNKRIAKTLSDLSLEPGEARVAANLVHCYEALVALGVLPEAELELVATWCRDLEAARTPVDRGREV